MKKLLIVATVVATIASTQCFAAPRLTTQLGFTVEQKQLNKDLNNEFKPKFAELTQQRKELRKKTKSLKEEKERKLIEIMTEKQRKSYETLKK